MDAPQSPDSANGSSAAIARVVIALVIVAAAAGLYGYLNESRKLSARAVRPAQRIDQTLSQLRRVDPSLLRWRQMAQLTTGLKEPRGIVPGPDGSVYVVGDQALETLSSAGQRIGAVAVSGPPTCVASDGKSEVIVGFADHFEVCDLARSAVVARSASFGPAAYLTCVAFSPAGIYVADAGNRVVLRCNRSGAVLARIGERDDARRIPGLFVPSPHLDVAPLPGNLVLVVNPGRHLVETYTARGELKGSWGRYGNEIDAFCGCCNPADIARLPDGRIVTAEKGLPRVKVFRPDGSLESVVAAPEQFSAQPPALDVAVDSLGRIYVLDPPARRITIFAAM